jgi:hypothetical protein
VIPDDTRELAVTAFTTESDTCDDCHKSLSDCDCQGTR